MFSFDTPPTPPTTTEDDLDVLRLIRSRRVGPASFHRLLAEHGSAAAALDALPAIAAAAGVEDYAPCPVRVAQAELAAGARAGARLVRVGGPGYPALLAQIADAPPVLWVRGSLAPLTRPAVAVIGARNASSLGWRMARGLAHGLAEAGLSVTAGLARGIDTAAHEASCDAGTIAVMAGGIDVIYPTENRALADRICEAGCLLTEQPPGVEPVARHFPARNRIVSGLSAGVVVIEAAHRSGTLITARCAAEQGREVMAVPGHPIDARAAGCNALIRDGATLVRNAADVIAALGPAALGPGGADESPGTAPGRFGSPEVSGRPAVGTCGPAPETAAGPPGLPADRAGSRPAAALVGGLAVGHSPGGSQETTPDTTSETTPAFALSPGQPDSLHTQLLALIGPSPTEEDALLRDLAVSPAQLAPVVLDLELDGRVIRLPGGRLALA